MRTSIVKSVGVYFEPKNTFTASISTQGGPNLEVLLTQVNEQVIEKFKLSDKTFMCPTYFDKMIDDIRKRGYACYSDNYLGLTICHKDKQRDYAIYDMREKDDDWFSWYGGETYSALGMPSSIMELPDGSMDKGEWVVNNAIDKLADYLLPKYKLCDVLCAEDQFEMGDYIIVLNYY